jgi:E3 ubiquitin-protein ligase RNF14
MESIFVARPPCNPSLSLMLPKINHTYFKLSAGIHSSGMTLLAQLEEAIALSSIYDDSFTLLSHDEPLDPSLLLTSEPSELESISLPLSFDCLAHVDASDGVKIVDERGVAQTVKHLPPIQLRLTLPDDYPSSRGPHISCHAIWISADRLRQLEDELASFWLPDEPVGFQCIDWLQHQALGLLCSSEDKTFSLPSNVVSFSGLLLSPSNKISMQMAGASVSLRSDEAGPSYRNAAAPDAPRFDLLSHLEQYDASLTLSDFRSTIQTCSICYDTSLGSSFVVLPCGGRGEIHAYCEVCITQHCESLITSGAVENLKCPEPSCRASLPPFILESVLGEEMYERYENLALKKALAAMKDLAYCPRCDAATIAGKSEDCCQCASCRYVFCGKCLGEYHPAEPCFSAAKQLEMKALIEDQRQNVRLAEEEKRRKRADLVAQMQSMARIQATTKPCPCCGAHIEKSEGCNQMNCSSCGSLFCWRCLTVIPKEVGYCYRFCIR